MQFYDNCTIDGIELEEGDIINLRRELSTVPTTSIAEQEPSDVIRRIPNKSIAEQEPMDVIRRTAEKAVSNVDLDLPDSHDTRENVIEIIMLYLTEKPEKFDELDCVQYHSMRIDEIVRADELLRIVVTDPKRQYQIVFTQNEDNFIDSNRHTVEPLEAFREHFGLTIFATTDDN